MKIKEGVIMQGLQLPMRKVLKKAALLWRNQREELVITSALDGTHSAGSYHYYGYALDLRTRYFTTTVSAELAKTLQFQLGEAYTVLFEGNHIHVQFNKDSL